MDAETEQVSALPDSYDLHVFMDTALTDITFACCCDATLVDEWDFAEGRFVQSIKMPANSGPVSYVKMLPNNKHLIWYESISWTLYMTVKESAL